MIRRLNLLALGAAVLAACTSKGVPETEPPASLLCVVRHAEAFKNLDPRPKGLSPERLDTLTPSGEARARALRAALPDGVARVLVSPTNRTRQTGELLNASPPVVEPALRPLDGDVSWGRRIAAWSQGQDPRPEGGESLADGAKRAKQLLARLRAELEPGAHAAVVTHGDIASILIGELRGTPLLERPQRDALDGGDMECRPIRPSGRSNVAGEARPRSR